MSRYKNAGRSHNINTDVSLKRRNSSNTWEQPERIKILFRKNYELTEVWECLLSFCAESFVFQLAI
jgi:hypothetical protein